MVRRMQVICGEIRNYILGFGQARSEVSESIQQEISNRLLVMSLELIDMD